MILYEHPFNERIRTYLRLEYLLERFEQLLLRSSEIDHHFALTTLFEIVDVGGRSDLKSDILKEENLFEFMSVTYFIFSHYFWIFFLQNRLKQNFGKIYVFFKSE